VGLQRAAGDERLFSPQSLSFLSSSHADDAAREAHSAGDVGRMHEELTSGLSYVRHHSSLAALIVLAAATTSSGSQLLTFLPIFAQKVFLRRRHLQPPDGVLGRPDRSSAR